MLAVARLTLFFSALPDLLRFSPRLRVSAVKLILDFSVSRCLRGRFGVWVAAMLLRVTLWFVSWLPCFAHWFLCALCGKKFFGCRSAALTVRDIPGFLAY